MVEKFTVSGRGGFRRKEDEFSLKYVALQLNMENPQNVQLVGSYVDLTQAMHVGVDIIHIDTGKLWCREDEIHQGEWGWRNRDSDWD